VPGRRLDPEERALWRKVTADVRPLATDAPPPSAGPTPRAAPPPSPAAPPMPEGVARLPRPARAGLPPKARRVAPDTLDGGWDRRLKRGLVAPDRAIDLHGHSLAGAYAALEAAIAQALTDEARVLLVVTGRAPRAGHERRGLIRAAIGDWIAGSAHASRIAAVRAAHPRHGGAGALYLILRRRR